jgi:hypothetical protein
MSARRVDWCPHRVLELVSIVPNAALIQARILSSREAEDGWGAWAEVEVLSSCPVSGEAFPNLAGRSVHVFVPPPLVATVREEQTFEGEITYQGGATGGMYCLRKRR